MPTLSELHVQRGRLQERIAFQRAALRRDLRPVQKALYATDHAFKGVHSCIAYLKQRPWLVGLAVAVLVAPKGRRITRLGRWLRRGYFFWRTWVSWRGKLHAFREIL